MSHPFDKLIQLPEKQEIDSVLIQAITFMSRTSHTHLTMQQIYDMLMADAHIGHVEVVSTGVSRDPVLHRIFGKMSTLQQTMYDGHAALHRSLDHLVNKTLAIMEQRIADQFKHLEGILVTATERLTTDIQALQAKVALLQTAYDKQSSSVNDANTRLMSEIATLKDLVSQLRNEAGSGNETAINALADQVEASTTTVSNISDGLTALSNQEDSVDPTPAPTALTIAPTSATLAPGGTQQFTANMPVTWKSNPDLGGSITPDGLYTAPANGSDTVTATSMDGTQNQSASVSVVA